MSKLTTHNTIAINARFTCHIKNTHKTAAEIFY